MTFDDYVRTVTQDKIVTKVVDTILSGNVLSLRFLSNAQPWGGEQMKFPIKYQSSGAGGSFDGFDTFDTTKTNTRTKMTFEPTGYYQSVVLSGMEVDVNATQAQVLDLIRVEMESSMQDMMDGVADALYAAQSGKSFIGIADIADDSSNVATYGGLSRATYTGIKGTYTDSSGTITLTKMGTLYDNCAVGANKPTLGVCNETVWGLIESLMQPTITHNVNTSGYPQVTRFGTVKNRAALRGEMGFDSIYFRGVPIVRDEKCTAQTLFFLNEDSIDFYGLDSHKHNSVDLSTKFHEGGGYDGGVPKSYGWSWTGLKEPVNQYAEIGQLILMGNLIGKNPRLNGQLHSITSA